jgi:chemotaxis protein histidine kinase CheA
MEKMTSKSFTSLLQDLPKKKDCCDMIQIQKNTLRKYEETNEMLKNFLELSENTHTMLLDKFTTHSKTLTTLKKDLEICFKRIRTLKTKLQVKYPEAFEATADAIKELQERYNLDEDDDDYRPPPPSRNDDTTIDETHVQPGTEGPTNVQPETESPTCEDQSGTSDIDKVLIPETENVPSVTDHTTSVTDHTTSGTDALLESENETSKEDSNGSSH